MISSNALLSVGESETGNELSQVTKIERSIDGPGCGFDLSVLNLRNAVPTNDVNEETENDEPLELRNAKPLTRLSLSSVINSLHMIGNGRIALRW